MKWVFWIAGIGGLIYGIEKLFGGKSKSVTDYALGKVGEIVGDVVDKEKSRRFWGKFRTGMIWLSGLGTLGTGVWFFLMRKKTPVDAGGFYQLGYLGLPAPMGAEADARYLAGKMKRIRDDRYNDIASAQSKNLAGLPVTRINATFGKPQFNNTSFPVKPWQGRGDN